MQMSSAVRSNMSWFLTAQLPTLHVQVTVDRDDVPIEQLPAQLVSGSQMCSLLPTLSRQLLHFNNTVGDVSACGADQYLLRTTCEEKNSGQSDLIVPKLTKVHV